MKISSQKINQFAAQLPLLIGRDMFLAFLILFIVALLVAGLVFYQYVYRLQSVEVAEVISETRFQAPTLRSLNETWQTRKASSEQLPNKQYHNPFLSLPSEQESSSN